MDRQPNRNGFERKRIAKIGQRVRPADHLAANLNAGRRDDVALLAVLVFQQREPRRASGIVLNGRHRGLDAMFVPLEIHEPEFLLVPAADAPRGGATVAIAPARLLARLDQALLGPGLRDVAKVRDRDVSRGRR